MVQDATRDTALLNLPLACAGRYKEDVHPGKHHSVAAANLRHSRGARAPLGPERVALRVALNKRVGLWGVG